MAPARYGSAPAAPTPPRACAAHSGASSQSLTVLPRARTRAAESNPEIFSEFAHKMGVPDSWDFVDVSITPMQHTTYVQPPVHV